MIYRRGAREDITNIRHLARETIGQELDSARVIEDIKRYPSKVAIEGNRLEGFVSAACER